MKQYKVVCILFQIKNFYLDNSIWNKFSFQNQINYMEDLKINVEIKNNLNFFYENLEIYDCIEKKGYVIRRESDIMLANQDWRNVNILSLKDADNGFAFLMQIFYTHAVQRHMLQFHSSLISHQNSGVMFLGPSGIGKTTQAELWNQYRDSLIINGDIVFVQETEKEILGWGTPWHGSSPYCENTSVPLRAMVVLKQAKENSIRELTGFEKVSEVSNHVFYPQWLENGMELCLETLDHLLTAIPVYELSCRPDEDAVRLTEETIFGT